MAEANKKYKVVLVGETHTGKTAIIQRIVNDRFEDNYESTMVASTLSTQVDLEGGRTVKFEIWDTAGQEKYRSINKIFYKDASIVIMVYDITQRNTYEEIKNYWYNQIVTMCNKNPIIAIVGNKSDLYIREEVKEKEAKEYAKEIGAVFQLTSCLRSEGIRELMQAIGQKALGEIEQKESHKQGGIDISKEKKEKKDKCCK